MIEDHPPLFKYLNVDAGLAVLRNGTLRWSTPGMLNDPYDVQFDLRIEIDTAAVKAATLEKIWEAHYGNQPVPAGNTLGYIIRALRGIFPRLSRQEFDREFGEAIDESLAKGFHNLPTFQEEVRIQLARSKILCLTTRPDSTLMWSHYAESHRGIVLEFLTPQGVDSPWKSAKPIEYVADLPRLIDDDFLSDMLSGRISMEPATILDRMIYTKSSEWRYEREWRIYSGDGRNPDAPYEDVPFNSLELGGVIFGCRMPFEIRAKFAELVRALYPKAELKQMEKSRLRFSMEMRPFEQKM